MKTLLAVLRTHCQPPYAILARTLLLGAALLFGMASSSLAESRHCGHPAVFPPHSHPYGKSYSQWAAEFWKWALALPLEEHPFLPSPSDPDFDFSANQSGKVWFWSAPDGPMTRRVSIPAGKAIFLTLRDVETSSLEAPPFFGATEAEQRANSEFFADHIEDLFCVIDGVPVRNLEDYRFATRQFRFNAPTPWIFGETGGRGTAVGEGYFLMLAPMRRGHHTIHYGGTFRFAAGELADEPLEFAKEITIELTVE
jgi:hypothetical protein